MTDERERFDDNPTREAQQLKADLEKHVEGLRDQWAKEGARPEGR